MSDPRQSRQQGDVRDDLALEVEEIADLEMPPVLADDVRGGKCHAVKPDLYTSPSLTQG
jgi:hypothetical protein